MESRMNVYLRVSAVILSYLATSGSGVADDYMLRALAFSHECHVQSKDVEIDLIDLAGPFSSRATACKAAADLHDSDGQDQRKCWRYGVITRRNCAGDGVTLPAAQ